MFAACDQLSDVRSSSGIGRIVRQRCVVQIGIGDVQSKSVRAARQPMFQHVERSPARASIAPVQLGLLAQEFVMVMLAARRLIRPGRSAERRQPVVRRRSVGACGSAQTYQSDFAPPAPAIGEPGMFVRRVAENFVDDDSSARAHARPFKQRVEIGQRAVVGMNAFIVRDVIAPVAVGRGMDRRQPDRIDAQLRDVIELGDQAGEIALPVAIAVAEAADIDLIDRRPRATRASRPSHLARALRSTLQTRP